MTSRRTAAIRICTALREAGHRALLAGGCVRDQLLGVEPKDYDIATDAMPAEVAELFPHSHDVGAAFGVQCVIEPEGHFEVTTFRRDGAYLDGRHPSSVEYADEEADAQRRDLTVNALFYDPHADQILDYVGGQNDIDRGVIRTVGDPRRRFAEDHLRLLRAVRFAARLDYTIAPETFEAIREMAPLVLTTSAERIRDEILRILTEGGARRAFQLLDETGLLEQVLPEVALMKGVEQPPEFHPEGDVFVHTLLMLHLMKTSSPTLALGVLLHDVGKPWTQTFEDRIRFNEHDKLGAEMAAATCRRLKMPRHATERVEWLVSQHMRLSAAPKMKESKLKRFVRHEGFHELLELCRLDCLGSHGDTDIIQWVEDYLANLTPEEIKPEPLLRGDDLIDMGYTPGPLFSEILSAVEDAQLEGSLHSTEEARAYVRANWSL